MVSPALLDSYLDKPIGQICLSGYNSANDNHCAHFVSHVLGLGFGLTCAAMGSRAGRPLRGANIRVQEVFANCPEANQLNECSQALSAGLIVVSEARHFISRPGVVNDARNLMSRLGRVHQIRNVPAKHIGIYCNGTVWHYSNSRSKVVKQDLAGFIHHYPRTAGTNALWWASFPPGTNPRTFGVCVAEHA